MANDRIFGRLKRPIYRKEISRTENAVGLALLLCLLGSIAWLAQQKNGYDPSSRDLALEDLQASAIQNISKKPLQRWGESGRNVEQQDLGDFPPNLLQGWSVARSLKRYTPENLFEKVNGQAEQYLKFGFTGLQTLALQNSLGQSADILLFQQKDFSQSLGLYAEQRSPEHVVLHQGSLHYTITSVGSFGISGPNFFQVMITGNPEQITLANEHFLKSLAQTKLGQDSSQQAFQLLLDAGAEFSDISYIPENVFQYGFASNFWFSKVFKDSDAKRFSHRALSREEALALLDQFKKVLPEDYRLALEQDGIYYYQHLHLKTFFAITVQGEILRGVDEVFDLDQAKSLMNPVPTKEKSPTSSVLPQQKILICPALQQEKSLMNPSSSSAYDSTEE